MKKFLVVVSVITVIAGLVFTVPAIAAKPGGEPEICNNGIDDDRDKHTDCNDSDCVGDPACPPGTCGNYTETDACNADLYCEWIGKKGSGYCASVLPPVNQYLGTLDTSSVDTEVHHDTPEAQAGNCTVCHGDLVDDMDDGHVIPTYEPGLVTPWPSGKDQSGVNGEGNCVFCHYAGVHESSSGPVPILNNAANHHNTGFYDKKGTKCGWCHDVYSVRPASISISAYSIRTCEGCHGLESLHNIQVDSDGDGIITPGAELPGFGHIGSNNDCNGCHGFSTAPTAAMTRSAVESAAVSAAESHHRLVGDPMPLESEAPNASATYGCVSCHTMTGNLETGAAVIAPADDCFSCHLTGPPSD